MNQSTLFITQLAFFRHYIGSYCISYNSLLRYTGRENGKTVHKKKLLNNTGHNTQKSETIQKLIT